MAEVFPDEPLIHPVKPNDLLTYAGSMDLERVIVIGVTTDGRGAYLMSNPDTAKAVFDLEIFKAKLMKEVLGG
jgi:hypothetical protein